MKTNYKNRVLVCLIVFVAIGIAAVDQPKASRYKNLQVLPKDISEEALNKIMDNMGKGLGVDCNYCHVKNKVADSLLFDLDDKSEKEIARNMMRMTKDINTKYFYFNESASIKQIQAVTCYTCHKGEPRPVQDSSQRK